MPRVAKSGTKGLLKYHTPGCANRGGVPTRCDCSWIGAYRANRVTLSEWSGHQVDPRRVKPAQEVLSRLRAAIDEGRFRREGEQHSLGSAQTFKAFIREWKSHYAQEHNLTSNSLDAMLGVLEELFGLWTLEHMAGVPREIELRLNEEAQTRKWSDNTWNRYYELLHTVLARAQKWKLMTNNPLASIDRRVGSSYRFIEVRLEEEVEQRLLAACDRLNRPQHRPHSKLLTWKKVKAIREAVRDGEEQAVVAARFGISRGLCCQIIKGDIWNPAKYRRGTKGDEMRLRVIAAFDTGLRRGEMMLVQLKHIDFKPFTVEVDGEHREVFRINLPATITKGGKTTGHAECVYIGSDRLKRALTRRRFELGRNREAYVFGTKDGRPQKGFRRMWEELFTLAGLDWGRDKGIVWHTLRHEFTSRTLEQADGDPVVAQKMARHKDLRTAQNYLHARDKRLAATATRLGRG